jgi:hypothetical protein
LHRLVQSGLCERSDDPGDRRQKRVRLTDEGRDVVKRLLKSRMADTHASIEPLSPEARRRLSEVLLMIVDELSTQAAQESPPSSPAAVPGVETGAAPRSFEDVLNDVEALGDDIADSAAAMGDAIAGKAAAMGDAVADRAAALGDAVAARAADHAARFVEKVQKNVSARVSRKKKQE